MGDKKKEEQNKKIRNKERHRWKWTYRWCGGGQVVG